jgi:hypothetical protein
MMAWRAAKGAPVEAPNVYCCGGAGEYNGGGGEEEKDGDAAAAFPHAVAPVGAPSVCCCGGAPSAHCCCCADKSKGGSGVEEENGDTAATVAHAVAPVGAPSVYWCGSAPRFYCCGGAGGLQGRRRRGGKGRAATRLLRWRKRWRPWERQARRRRGFTAAEWRDYRQLCCCAEKRMFRIPFPRTRKLNRRVLLKGAAR